jgi:hypothetical protein
VLKGHDELVWSVCSITTAEGAVRIVSGSWDKAVRICMELCQRFTKCGGCSPR